MPSSRNRRVGVTRKPPVIGRATLASTLKFMKPGAAESAALVTRFVRFMDDQFGAGNWEQRDGEPEDNAALRDGMFLAFKAGAGVD